jgi:ribosomal protein S18 acetylase RimI-like enzyme
MLIISIENNWDIEEIVNISDLCFGENYLNYEHIVNAIKASKLITLKINSSLIGFCIFSTPENKQTPCYIETIAIKPQHHKKGFGTKILVQTLSTLQKQGFNKVNYKAWVEGPNNFFISKIKRIGFVKLEEIKDYWKEESITQPFNCIVCGSPPCNCTVSIYQLNF